MDFVPSVEANNEKAMDHEIRGFFRKYAFRFFFKGFLDKNDGIIYSRFIEKTFWIKTIGEQS